jgi:hypothetical protein
VARQLFAQDQSGAGMNKSKSLVIASFDQKESAARAMETLRESWAGEWSAFSPFYSETFFLAAGLDNSPTRFWVLAGGLIGFLGAWATTIMLTIYWLHYVGNMPPIALPPFTIIAFELMVLFGVLIGTVGLMFHGGRTRALEAPPEFMKRFKLDRIGIVVGCAGADERIRIESMMRQLGAEEIANVPA